MALHFTRIPEKPTHRITSHVATILFNHLAKLLQKIIASQKNQNIASHVATILCIILQSFYSPNEDLRRPDKPFGVTFRSTFQGCENAIWATKRWSVLRKCTPKRWFGFPKSSFGEHKVVTKDHSIPEKPTHRIIAYSFLL